MAPAIAEALISLAPDWLILTEYVAHDAHASFFDRLADYGLRHARISAYAAKNNRVVVASRWELEPGSIQAPAIDEAMPSNALHVTAPTCDVEVLGLRLPDYSKQPAVRRAWWDWLMTTAESAIRRPIILAGDLNTDASYPRARCGDRLERLTHAGWRHAIPDEGVSYWTLNGDGKRIDHAFVSPHFRVVDARYVTEAAGHRLIGKPAQALSDHAALIVDLERTNV
jgi:endonuclease/exonuclease/phosphatase family metal-dependent hydrolase